jgi:hypothetical protein
VWQRKKQWQTKTESVLQANREERIAACGAVSGQFFVLQFQYTGAEPIILIFIFDFWTITNNNILYHAKASTLNAS